MRRCLPPALKGLVLILGLGVAVLSRAERPAADIKAAFIYNFAKFVEWPRGAFPDKHSPLQLCEWGRPLDGRLTLLNGREAQGRSIRVREVDGPEGMSGCHILVIGDIGESLRDPFLQAPVRPAMLTISDSPDFTHQGGMIGLFVAASRVQFSVNLGVAQAAGLRMSARMLQLAHGVRGGAP